MATHPWACTELKLKAKIRIPNTIAILNCFIFMFKLFMVDFIKVYGICIERLV